MNERKIGEIFYDVQSRKKLICIANKDNRGDCVFTLDKCRDCSPFYQKCIGFIRSDKTNVHYEVWNGKPYNGYHINH